MTTDIKTAAEAYLRSYQKAVSQGADPTNTTLQVATAITSHYGPGFTSFTSGHIAANGSSANEIQKCAAYLDFLKKSGLGTTFKLDKFRIEVVSRSSALCYATWSIDPVDGRDGWNWENVYGYRRLLNRQNHEHDGGNNNNNNNNNDTTGGGGGGGGGSTSSSNTNTNTNTNSSSNNTDETRNEHVSAEGYWEFVVSDNELDSIVERVPTIFDDMFGSR